MAILFKIMLRYGAVTFAIALFKFATRRYFSKQPKGSSTTAGLKAGGPLLMFIFQIIAQNYARRRIIR